MTTERLCSIRAGKPSHGEFDAIAGKLAPGFDLGHVGRLGKAAKHFTRLCARLLARQREGLAPERIAWPHTQRFRRAASDVGGTTAGAHDTPRPRSVMPNGARSESSWRGPRTCLRDPSGAGVTQSRPPPHPPSPLLPPHLPESRPRSTPPPPPRAPRRGAVPSARRAP